MKKYFNKKNFLKVIIIFTVGFISRVLVNDFFGINVYFDYLHSVSLIYYALLSIFIVLVHEYLTYVEFNILSSILKIIHTILKYSVKNFDYYCKNIRIFLIRKIFNSYNSTSYSKMYVKDSSYNSSNNPNTLPGINGSSSSFTPINLPKSSDSSGIKLPSIKDSGLFPKDITSSSHINSSNHIANSKNITNIKKSLVIDFPISRVPATKVSDYAPSSSSSVLSSETSLHIYKKELDQAVSGRNTNNNWNEKTFSKNFRRKFINDFNEFVKRNRNSIEYPDTTLNNTRSRCFRALYKGSSLDEAIKELPMGIRESYKQYMIELERERNK